LRIPAGTGCAHDCILHCQRCAPPRLDGFSTSMELHHAHAFDIRGNEDINQVGRKANGKDEVLSDEHRPGGAPRTFRGPDGQSLRFHAMAEAIGEALVMPAGEQRERMRLIRDLARVRSV
jgi:hypothetical protein